MKFGKRTIFDYLTEGKIDDAALARRMKDWISGNKPAAAERAIKLYWKQSDEKRASLAANGLSEKYVKKYEAKLNRNKEN